MSDLVLLNLQADIDLPRQLNCQNCYNASVVSTQQWWNQSFSRVQDL